MTLINSIFLQRLFGEKINLILNYIKLYIELQKNALKLYISQKRVQIVEPNTCKISLQMLQILEQKSTVMITVIRLKKLWPIIYMYVINSYFFKTWEFSKFHEAFLKRLKMIRKIRYVKFKKKIWKMKKNYQVKNICVSNSAIK